MIKIMDRKQVDVFILFYYDHKWQHGFHDNQVSLDIKREALAAVLHLANLANLHEFASRIVHSLMEVR